MLLLLLLVTTSGAAAGFHRQLSLSQFMATAQSLSDSVHNQNSRSDHATQTDHGVSSPEGHEPSCVVGRLECRQKSEHAESCDGQKEQRAENGDNDFHLAGPVKRSRRR